MSYKSISTQRHRYLRRDYTGNRSEELVDPLESYQIDVAKWVLNNPSRKQSHCKALMKVVANPSMLDIAQQHLGISTRLLERGPDMWKWLRDLQTRLLSQTFERGEYEKYEIPKPGKPGTRTIEEPPEETRIVARNLLNLLNPLLDPDFYPLSIGFRPKRSVLHGIAAAERLIDRGLTHWVACDIKDAFGQLPKKRALEILSKRLFGSPVMWLVEELLDPTRKRGVPQGVNVSPLLLNVYMDHLFDRWWLKESTDACLIRYADDILIACPSQESAVNSFASVSHRLEQIGLKVKECQAEAVSDLAAGDRVDWLGFRAHLVDGEMRLSVGESSWDKLEATLSVCKFKMLQGEKFSPYELASIGFQWVSQKAVGLSEAQLPVVAEQIRTLADQCGLDLSKFSDQRAWQAWNRGCESAEKASVEVLEWLPPA